MSSSKPPVLATWFLEHLAIGANREALAGDLLEQFSQHRSSTWYWRQALAAVALGLWKEQRILWVAMGFTVVWLALLPQFYGSLWRIVYTSGIFFSAYPSLPWPLSEANTVAFFSVIYGLPLPAALCVYLAMIKDFSLRRLLRGLLVGLLALPLCVIPDLALLSAIWSRVPHVFAYAAASLPLFASMLISMWAMNLWHGFPDPEREQV